jgi:hypothetical protein
MSAVMAGILFMQTAMHADSGLAHGHVEREEAWFSGTATT